MRGFLTAWLLLAWICPSMATVYHVATNGLDGASGLTTNTPWRTLQHAVDSVGAGDRILVRGGIYEERVAFNVSGSAGGGFVTLIGFAGETPTIDGSNLTVGSGADALIAIDGHDYIAVSGFELRNFTTSSADSVPIGIYVAGDATHIRLTNLRIHHIETNYDSGGNYISGADAHGLAVYGNSSGAVSNLLIDGVEIHNCKLGSSEAMVLNGNVDGFAVRNCRIHDNNNIGIDFIGHEGTCADSALDQTRNGICEGNLVYNINTTGNPAYRSDGSYDRSAGGIYVDGGRQIVIDRNVVHDCDIGIEVASEHNGKFTSQVTVRNNFIYRCYTGGIFCGGYDSARGNAQYCYFIGNTLYHNDTGRNYNGEIHLQWHIMDSEFENNLLVALKNDGGDAVYVGGPGGSGSTPLNTRFNYNGYFCDDPASGGPSFRWGNAEKYTFFWWQAQGHETNGTYSIDPLLVDVSSGNLHLQTNSPAINRGRFRTDGGTLDIDGHPRITGSAIDLGADEIDGPPPPGFRACVY